MGYTHGIRWSNEMIKESLIEVIDNLDLNHFPTHTEIEGYYHNKALTNVISKKGGTKYWSKVMNLPLKDSCTTLGNMYEEIAQKHIVDTLKLKADLTSSGHPYDILVDDSVKVDVKTSSKIKSGKNAYVWTFNIEKRQQTCDIYVLYCLAESGEDVVKTVVIPSVMVSGQTQIGIGEMSKWDMYIDRWDYINQYADFYSAFKKKPESLKYVPSRYTTHCSM